MHTFAAALVAVSVASVSGCHRTSGASNTESSRSAKAEPLPVAASNRVAIPDVVSRVLPSVVNISMTRTESLRTNGVPFFDDPFFRRFFGSETRPPKRVEHGLGSGVIVTKDGVILTNNHVVDKASDILVTTTDKREFHAKVVGTDPKTDLAVVQVTEKVDDLRPIEFGQSSQLRLGDIVLAIGDPFGVGQTVTMGIVSAKGRANLGIVDYEDFIQTDAAINPGNSGGALVSLDGKLVGVNTAILSRSGGSSGVGFAIPSDMVKPIMDSLLKYGKVRRGWLGVVIQNVDADIAKAMSLPKAEGVLISDVVASGPGAKAGLERGDVVLKIDGKPVNSANELRNFVALAGSDAKVKLDVLRNDKQVTIDVGLGEMPSSRDAGSIAGEAQAPGTVSNLDGLTLQTVDAVARARLHLPDAVHGVAITNVESGSDAEHAGLHSGDVVTELDRSPINGIDDFGRAWRAAGHAVLLLVYRDGRTMFVVLHK